MYGVVSVTSRVESGCNRAGDVCPAAAGAATCVAQLACSGELRGVPQAAGISSVALASCGLANGGMKIVHHALLSACSALKIWQKLACESS
jgi:hypothetical protein